MSRETIVLNERVWMENAIRTGRVDSMYRAVDRAARYFFQEGFRRDELWRKVENFMVACDRRVNLVTWADTIEKCVNEAGNRPLLELDGVQITVPEEKTIRSLKNHRKERVAFTLLCLAKYYDAAREKNRHWVSTEHTEIFRMAGVSGGVDQRCAMLRALRDAGLIGFNRIVDNVNPQVLFVQDGKPAFMVDDFRALGNLWVSRLPGNESGFVPCSECGLLIPRRTSAVRYCASCGGAKG